MPRYPDGKKHFAVILTALPVEFNAVRKHLKFIEEKEHPLGTIYEQGVFSYNGQSLEIGIAEIGEGNEQAALEVERAIQYFNPSIILFVGVAGGVKDDVKLGDVVVASKVYGYESGKAGDTFKPRPQLSSPNYKMLNRAKAEARKDNWLQHLGQVPNPPPTVFVKPIAAGGKVISSSLSEAYKLIKSNFEDTLAVEMEGYGFLKATFANPQVDALVIRGISDLIDNKDKADKAGFQDIASCHATAFAFQILAKLYIEPLQNTGTHKVSEKYGIPKTFTNSSTGMEFILIPAGKFMMGSPSDEYGRYDNESPYHKIKIDKPFYMGKYPVTQKQWGKIMVEYNPTDFFGEDRPIESVSWYNAQEFIRVLNQKENTYKYRLPSETEWEYACRAGSHTRYYFGDNESNLNEYAWYNKNACTETHPVGQKKPNLWGLYDMPGNVEEWCQDKWHNKYEGAPSDGSAWEVGGTSERISRGGSWYYYAWNCRSADRGWYDPEVRRRDLGFRLVMDI
jgi:formylglycine-generating enzyme required for sulfatase activity